MKKSLLADRVFNRPLLVAGSKANIIAPFLAEEILGNNVVVNNFSDASVNALQKHAGKLGTSEENSIDKTLEQSVPRTNNGVGLIAIEGTLINKGGWIGSYSGETTYQGLMRQIAEARADEAIKAVVFEIDSYGGEVAGCSDCGAAIADLSKEKPTLAICTDHAYSAAYWLASQCNQIIIPASGGVGSIGVISLHVNYKDWLKKEGLEVSILAAGEHKADGHPYDKLPDAVREEFLAESEIVRNQFAQAVADGRGSRFSKKSALASEAKCFMGEAAVEAGLADLVARPSEAFANFVKMF